LAINAASCFDIPSLWQESGICSISFSAWLRIDLFDMLSFKNFIKLELSFEGLSTLCAAFGFMFWIFASDLLDVEVLNTLDESLWYDFGSIKEMFD